MGDLYCVYKHTAPNGKVYIGQTKAGVDARWKNGKGYTSHRHGWFWKAIEKYGWENIKHEVLYDNLDKDTADYYEKFFIDLYQSTNRKNGYNCQTGGSRNYNYSEDSKRNISEGLKRFYEENGKPDTAKARTVLQEKQGRKVVQYDLNGKRIADYESAYDAYLKTGISNVKINTCLCLPDRHRTAGGFQWRYFEESTEFIAPYKFLTPCVQYDLNGKRIREWEDVKEADKYYSSGRKRTAVEKCCDGKYKTAYGFMWRYRSNAPSVLDPIQVGKPVFQYDTSGNIVKRWKNSAEVQNTLGWNVKNACEHRSKTSFGYQWRYEGDNTPLLKIEKPHIVKKRIRQYKNEKYIAEYESTKVASIETGISAKNIQSCASGRNKTAGKYQWRYVVEHEDLKLKEVE